MTHLPQHLEKYVVKQNYEKYTPQDQAVWRFVLRQLRDFLSQNAHECYLDGLEKTGIDVESIPRIEAISQKLEKFGWQAVPVSGFIPPAAFMELQSLSILPIASDMRSVDHLLYTPAPDIVHEAAGHAPILVNSEFVTYLKAYAQVAKKAILSKEDLDMYEAIRDLSDVKENPSSTPADIFKAERHLEEVSKSSSHISEASELSRMNWWTAEYGLIGDINNPKIFGAGLLSSMGESKLCLGDNVQKIPFSLDCIKKGYDITEPQPQLYVTPDFKTLTEVLYQMADQMAFKVGGVKGLEKALQSETVNTVQLDTGLQISSELCEYFSTNNGEIFFIKFKGPTQLAYADSELSGHGVKYHAQGFSSPIGKIKSSSIEFKLIANSVGQKIDLVYESGFKVRGQIKSLLNIDGKNLILALDQATAEYNSKIYFQPDWGTFDIALGTTVSSVFGGPVDRVKFGLTDDFVASKVPQPVYSESTRKLHSLYLKVRTLREQKITGDALKSSLSEVYQTLQKEFPQDWLLQVEIYELLLKNKNSVDLAEQIRKNLLQMKLEKPVKETIADGLRLAPF